MHLSSYHWLNFSTQSDKTNCVSIALINQILDISSEGVKINVIIEEVEKIKTYYKEI